MVKKIGGVNLLCVPIAHGTDCVMKNKPVFPYKFWKFHIVLC